MTPSTHRVNFMDECPRIGSGWRRVRARVGRKWVHLECPYTGNKNRLRKHEWESIVAKEAPTRC